MRSLHIICTNILPNQDYSIAEKQSLPEYSSESGLLHRRKVIPARIFFRIRITPSLKSNPLQNVLPNKDASYRNKTSKDTSFPSGSQFPTALVRSKFPIYMQSGEPQRFHAPILLITTKTHISFINKIKGKLYALRITLMKGRIPAFFHNHISRLTDRILVLSRLYCRSRSACT